MTLNYSELILRCEKLKKELSKTLLWQKGRLSCHKTSDENRFEIRKDGEHFVDLICGGKRA